MMPGSRRPASAASVYRMIVPWQTMIDVAVAVVGRDPGERRRCPRATTDASVSAPG